MSAEDGELIVDAVVTRLYTPDGVRVYIDNLCHQLAGQNNFRGGWYAVCGEVYGVARFTRETYDPLTCVLCATGWRR